MKIYIDNLNINLLKDIQNLLESYLITSEYYIQIYTNEGIYKIEKNNIYSLEPLDKDIEIYKNYYNNFTLIVDSSYFKKTYVSSIYGNTHLSLNIKKNIYKLNKTSKIQLVIENNDNKLFDNFVPFDIYFESNENIDINELFIKQEINEFLSVLN